MDKIHFKIQGLPKTTNAGGRLHWRHQQLHAKKWKAHVRTALWLSTSNFPFDDSPWTKAKLTLIRHSSREPDFDGLVSSFKAIIDGLVGAKCIVDDKSSNIGQPSYLWHKCAQNAGHIEVIVEKIE